MLKKIERTVLEHEKRHSFKPEWYGIFFNPFFIARRELYEAVLNFSQTIPKTARILDVGCGIKPYRHLFAGNEYVGIDVQGGGHDDKAKDVTHYFDGTNIPFPEESFDIVISTQVFEHAKNLEALVSEIHRVLKVGGTLFVTMPFVWPEHEIPFDFRRLTSFGHRELLERHNFFTEKIVPTTGVFGTCGQILSDFFVSATNSLLGRMSSAGFGHKIKFILARLSVFLICFPVQLFFIVLDSIFQRKGLTLDYVVYAKKQS